MDKELARQVTQKLDEQTTELEILNNNMEKLEKSISRLADILSKVAGRL